MSPRNWVSNRDVLRALRTLKHHDIDVIGTFLRPPETLRKALVLGGA